MAALAWRRGVSGGACSLSPSLRYKLFGPCRVGNAVNTSEATLLKFGRYERTLLVQERHDNSLA